VFIPGKKTEEYNGGISRSLETSEKDENVKSIIGHNNIFMSICSQERIRFNIYI